MFAGTGPGQDQAMATELHVFISSKMQELAAERQALRAMAMTD